MRIAKIKAPHHHALLTGGSAPRRLRCCDVWHYRPVSIQAVAILRCCPLSVSLPVSCSRLKSALGIFLHSNTRSCYNRHYETFDGEVRGPAYTSSLLDFYFSGTRIGVRDIETTGLSPARNKFILGGLLDLQAMTMHQYLAENRGEERQVLEDFAEKVSGLDMAITYNGRHFDMPFIDGDWSGFPQEAARRTIWIFTRRQRPLAESNSFPI